MFNPLDLILTVFVYLIFPIIYVISEGKTDSSKGKKLALWNSIIGAVIFMIIRGIVTGGEEVVASNGFAPALLYYFIAKAILVDKNKTIEQKNISQKQSIDTEENMVLCENCGYQIFEEDEKCSKCGNNIINNNLLKDDKVLKI